MKLEMPRKRIFLGFHRWLGIASAIFLLVLALTGLALNHTERLGLNRIKISQPLILARYGMVAGGDISSFRIGNADTLSHLDGQLYFNGEPLTDGELPVRIWDEDGLLVIGTPAETIYLTAAGEFVERIAGAPGPEERAQSLQMEHVEPGDDIRRAILSHHQGEGVSLYRVLLDLHSGRLFGWGGRTVMDLTAVAILLLVSSGLAGWLRKSRWAA